MTTRTTSRPAPARRDLLDRPEVVAPGRAPFLLTSGLAVAAIAAAAPSLLVPGVLGGEDVTRGNLRGTALVVLLAVPLLLAAMTAASRNSARWLVVWIGAAAYLTYQAVLFCFATPYNNLFLCYVAFLGLGAYTLLALLGRVDVGGFRARVDDRLPRALVGGTIVGFGTLNGLAWLAKVAPTVLADDPASVLDGSGLLTSPVWVQDLAFWIPAVITIGVWAWRGRPRGLLLSGAVLTYYALECLSIASDQSWGARADATQPQWASAAMVPVFAAVGLLTLAPLALHLRNLDRH